MSTSRFEVADTASVSGGFDRGDPSSFQVADLDLRDRSHYGRVVIWGYLALIAFVCVLPLAIWASVSGGGEEFHKGLADVQNLIVALLAGLSGVAGLAGLVVGRYFGDKTEPKPPNAKRKKSTS